MLSKEDQAKLIAGLPLKTGIYLIRNCHDQVIYIGKANLLRERVKQYFIEGRDTRPMVPLLIQEIASIETIVVDSERSALLLENDLIKKHQPKFNICLKDDKHFICLTIDPQSAWPRLRLKRAKLSRSQKGLWFGPYPSATAAKQLFSLLIQLFALRQCKDSEFHQRTRPCILYAMQRCSAPCVGKIDQAQYSQSVESAIRVLGGKIHEAEKELLKQIDEASKQLNFEQAALLEQKRIALLTLLGKNGIASLHVQHITQAFALARLSHIIVIVSITFHPEEPLEKDVYVFENVVVSSSEALKSILLQLYNKSAAPAPHHLLLPFAPHDEQAVVALLRSLGALKIEIPQKGKQEALLKIAQENAEATLAQYLSQEENDGKLLLKELQRQCGWPTIPSMIYGIDTSHISGEHYVGVAVSFIEAKKETSGYRSFSLANLSTIDDGAAIAQTVKRLLTSLEGKRMPDLILVDGGLIQWKAAHHVLQELSLTAIKLLAITKERGNHGRGLLKEALCYSAEKPSLYLAPTSPPLLFLQRIRDEAHRRAITLLRQAQSKKIKQSALRDIPGIGIKKQQLLLRHYGSLEKIRNSPLEELIAIPGLSRKDALQIQAHFNNRAID